MHSTFVMTNEGIVSEQGYILAQLSICALQQIRILPQTYTVSQKINIELMGCVAQSKNLDLGTEQKQRAEHTCVKD